MIGLAVAAGFLGGAAFGWELPGAIGLVLVAWQIATRYHVSLPVIVLSAAAIALGVWRGEPLPDSDDIHWSNDETSFTGIVAGVPGIRSDSQVFFMRIDSPGDVDGEQRFYVTAPALPEAGPGDHIWIAGVRTPLSELPSGFGRYVRSNNAVGTISAGAIRIEDRADGWRRLPYRASVWFGRLVNSVAPGDRGALLAGLVTGRDDALSTERKDAFRRSGTSHITAVSGSNLALLVTIATISGRETGLRRRVGWQIAVGVALWGYVLLAGFQPPVYRAGLVATGAIVAGLLGRRADVVTLLALGGAFMVAVDPLVLWSVSFQLSLAASLGLAVVFGLDVPTGMSGWTRVAVLSSVAPQFATLPFAVGTFGQIPLLAIPANLIVAPLAGCAFMLAALAGAVGVVFEPAGTLIASIAAVPAGLVLNVVDLLGGSNTVVHVRSETVDVVAVSVFCAIVICLWSRDGQVWLERTVDDAVRHRGRVVTMFGTAALGAAVILTV